MSVDIDVLDPAFAPARDTLEEVASPPVSCSLFCGRCRADQIVAADVVEVSPPYDHAEITSLAAATVIYDLLAVVARSAHGAAAIEVSL